MPNHISMICNCSFKKVHHPSNEEVTEFLINTVRGKRGWRNDSLETGLHRGEVRLING